LIGCLYSFHLNLSNRLCLANYFIARYVYATYAIVSLMLQVMVLRCVKSYQILTNADLATERPSIIFWLYKNNVDILFIYLFSIATFKMIPMIINCKNLSYNKHDIL
jgi:hypothetical protein